MNSVQRTISAALHIGCQHTVQAGYAGSGCVRRKRVMLQADLVPMLQKRPSELLASRRQLSLVQMEVCKELLSRASEIRSFYTVQGSYNRSGYVTRERVKLQVDVVPMLHKRPLGAPRQPKAAFLGANGRLQRIALKGFGDAFVL